MPDDNKTQMHELIAGALANSSAEKLREVVAALVREQLQGWECKRIIEEAIAPVIRGMVGEMLSESAVLDALQERVRQETLRLVGTLLIHVPTRSA